MKGKLNSYRETYPSVDQKDRFTALKEVQIILKSKQICWQSVFEALSKADNANLEFSVGDFVVQFTRGFGVWSERKDTVQLSIELQKGDAGEIVAYEYKLNELIPSRNMKHFELGFPERSG